MINATHYVLDLETMGKGPRSAIVAIGCVRIENLKITGEFYHRVPLRSSMECGLQVDASTIQWWLEQEEAARVEITGGSATELPHALGWLAAFMGVNDDQPPSKNALLWGNGSSFDNVIVGNAFDACNIQRPWMFWNDRDLRTLLALYPEAKVIPFEGTKHHALHDAQHEARQLIAALQIHLARQQDARP
ncbi:MAG: 3'-5' exoribonuclease [Gammaproteobacteria bacterium]|uniref:3'-5' exoribonuclease Rv2179c-like domain-containing protein n=1 Tax=viral metagenome TaxID=1070528 RepID=A0A6M3M2N3_9ZZZZ|nr:3'-5' exoribonuclease [Gammaproteobacteria bacterium]MBU0883272.1 3'-5' exoribonuclease [Gammaproteobacteria bacterium]MBU1858775.1 3'-5' exoribonuclease [Gammaproteobacteria bacterium]